MFHRKLKTRKRKQTLKTKKRNFSIFSQETSEESDGISVISEGEICKTFSLTPSPDSENENEKTADEKDETVEKIDDDDNDSWKANEYQPLTPPSTPNQELKVTEMENESSIIIEDRIHLPSLLLFATAFFFIVSVLYSLRCEIKANENRISNIELENNLLREAFDKLGKSFHQTSEPMQSDEAIKPECCDDEDEPSTKGIWLGSENKIIGDERNELPDFCYFTDKDDLFYDYNLELCERKKHKLEHKNKKNTKEPKMKHRSIDLSMHQLSEDNGKEKSYDDYVAEVLKSLNDEILEIKSKRVNPSEVAADKKLKEEETADKPASEKRREFRESKRSRKQKSQSPDEWIDKRTSGREEARKNREKEQQDSVNWHLKRKREALRVDTVRTLSS